MSYVVLTRNMTRCPSRYCTYPSSFQLLVKCRIITICQISHIHTTHNVEHRLDITVCLLYGNVYSRPVRLYIFLKSKTFDHKQKVNHVLCFVLLVSAGLWRSTVGGFRVSVQKKWFTTVRLCTSCLVCTCIQLQSGFTRGVLSFFLQFKSV